MEKMIKFLLIFLSAIFLYGGEIDQFFTNFDKSYDSSSQVEKQNFHNKLKNIYLKTATGSDKKYRVPALQRLIYSSENLGYNANSYKDELNRLGAKTSSTTSKVANSQKNLNSTKQAKVIKNETINQNTKTQNSKNLQKDTKNVNSDTKLTLNSVNKENNALVLNFNRDIKNSDYSDFRLSSEDNHRFVMDFKATLNTKNQNIDNFIYDEIRVAQFDTKTARIVLKNSVKFNPNIKIDGNSLIISQDKNAKITTSKKEDNVLNKNTQKTNKNSKIKKEQDYENTQAITAHKIYKSTKGKLIVIDPGHGGKDAGAMGNNLKEKNIVLNTATKLGTLLKKRGYKVLYTRSSDVFINLKSRTAFANKKNADMFISVHANAAPNAKQASKFSGVETFFLSPARSERSKNAAALENKGDLEDMNEFSQETFLNFLNREKIIASNKLAIDIQGYMLNAVQKKFKSKDGGVREAPFWVLVGATMPAVLVEMGYISHPNEGILLGKNEYQNAIANGIANGIDAYFQKNK